MPDGMGKAYLVMMMMMMMMVMMMLMLLMMLMMLMLLMMTRRITMMMMTRMTEGVGARWDGEGLPDYAIPVTFDCMPSA